MLSYAFTGAGTKYIVAEERLRAWSVDHHIATLDGSCGHQGLVTDLLMVEILCREFSLSIPAGEPMMKVVQAWAHKNDIQEAFSGRVHGLWDRSLSGLCPQTAIR